VALHPSATADDGAVSGIPVRSTPPGSQRLAVQATWSGPIPPPAALAEYEQAHPGTAERLLSAFETEGAHRRAAENRQLAHADRLVDAQIWVMKVGTVSTVVIGTLGLIAATVLGATGHAIPATILGASEMAGLTLLGIFRRPKHPPSDEPK
jgi:uncharacterized membrane protein